MSAETIDHNTFV